METNQAPLENKQPAEDHLLEDLAALTGLFNPEVLWHREEQLDDLDEADQAQKGAEGPASPGPGTAAPGA